MYLLRVTLQVSEPMSVGFHSLLIAFKLLIDRQVGVLGRLEEPARHTLHIFHMKLWWDTWTTIATAVLGRADNSSAVGNRFGYRGQEQDNNVALPPGDPWALCGPWEFLPIFSVVPFKLLPHTGAQKEWVKISSWQWFFFTHLNSEEWHRHLKNTTVLFTLHKKELQEDGSWVGGSCSQCLPEPIWKLQLNWGTSTLKY